MKEKMLKRPKKDSVLVKHKKWLADLQKTKERLEDQYIDEMRRKEESQQKFQDYEKRMRDLSRTLLDKQSEEKDNNSSSSKSNNNNNNNYSLAESKSSTSFGPGMDYKDAKGMSSSSSFVSNKKPAWAMSQTNANAISEAKQQSEEDELLQFVDHLDFDQTIQEIEIKVMTDKLRKRIEELEKEVIVEDQRETDADIRAAKREMLELMGKAEQSLQGLSDDQLTNENKIAFYAAKALLDEEEEMQQVHSMKSMAVLMKTAKEKIQQVSLSVHPIPAKEVTVLNEPKIVLHDPNEGARLGDKNNISNLPYMHRNPAV